jgi:SAM-dependent methyltransferase
MSANIAYRTDELARYFSRNRIRWEQFYESERAILGRLGLKAGHSVLDIGCGCGGLGMALQDKFGVTDYTGVEINGAAAAAGRVLNPGARILEGDVLEVSGADLRGSVFDLVVSLSCVDWNVCFHDMLAAAWRHVRPGGFLV